MVIVLPNRNYLVQHWLYRGSYNMKINEWGVFVERPNTSTYEIKLSEDLASKVSEYIQKLKEDDENILSGNTKGKILW